MPLPGVNRRAAEPRRSGRRVFAVSGSGPFSPSASSALPSAPLRFSGISQGTLGRHDDELLDGQLGAGEDLDEQLGDAVGAHHGGAVEGGALVPEGGVDGARVERGDAYVEG